MGPLFWSHNQRYSMMMMILMMMMIDNHSSGTGQNCTLCTSFHNVNVGVSACHTKAWWLLLVFPSFAEMLDFLGSRKFVK